MKRTVNRGTFDVSPTSSDGHPTPAAKGSKEKCELLMRPYYVAVNSEGNATVPCCIPHGTFLVFIREDLPLDSSTTPHHPPSILISSAAWIFSSDHVFYRSNRLCHLVTEKMPSGDPQSVISSGGLIEVSERGELLISRCQPHSRLSIQIVRPEALSSLTEQIIQLQHENDRLHTMVSELSDRLDEIYFSPGMPGYMQAREHYEKLEKNE